MWDHLFFGPAYAVGTVTHGWLADASYEAEATAEYIQERSGILTNVGGDILGSSFFFLFLTINKKLRNSN